MFLAIFFIPGVLLWMRSCLLGQENSGTSILIFPVKSFYCQMTNNPKSQIFVKTNEEGRLYFSWFLLRTDKQPKCTV